MRNSAEDTREDVARTKGVRDHEEQTVEQLLIVVHGCKHRLEWQAGS